MKVVYLEDDSVDVRLAQAAAKTELPEGTQVRIVHNFVEFVDEISKPAFIDLLLIDYSLPYFSGLDAVEIIKKNIPMKVDKIVMVTGEPEIVPEAIRRGADMAWIKNDGYARLMKACMGLIGHE